MTWREPFGFPFSNASWLTSAPLAVQNGRRTLRELEWKKKGTEKSFILAPYEPGSKLVVLGMAIPPLIGNPYNGYINPYYWVDDHPPLYGNNGSLDPSTYIQHCYISFSKKKRVILMICAPAGTSHFRLCGWWFHLSPSQLRSPAESIDGAYTPKRTKPKNILGKKGQSKNFTNLQKKHDES